MPELYLYRDLEAIKREGAATEKAVIKEEFQGEWTVPVYCYSTRERSLSGLKVPLQQFLTKDWSPQLSLKTYLKLPLLS